MICISFTVNLQAHTEESSYNDEQLLMEDVFNYDTNDVVPFTWREIINFIYNQLLEFIESYFLSYYFLHITLFTCSIYKTFLYCISMFVTVRV